MDFQNKSQISLLSTKAQPKTTRGKYTSHFLIEQYLLGAICDPNLHTLNPQPQILDPKP